MTGDSADLCTTVLPGSTSELATRQRRDLLVELLTLRSREPLVYPLSPPQHRLWLLHQIEPASAAYNLPIGLLLRGSLDTQALHRGLLHMARRHEILRTSFELRDGQPVQVVAPECLVELPVLDLSATPAAERFAAARRFANLEVHTPFDLEQVPLWRARLIRLSDDEHVLLCTFHHTVSDGWSMGVFLRELGVVYAGYSNDAVPALPDLAIQYGDYARWQIERLSSGISSWQMAYWKHQLQGAPPVLQLPSDRTRMPEQTFDGASQSRALPRDLALVLEKLALSEQATLFMVMLAAFKVLLHRYTGADDVLVGVPVAGRTHVETEPLIGFFVNTLVLRTGVSGSATFRDLLGRVRGVTLAALAHSDVPFEKLVEELKPERSLSYNPVFQVMFVAIKAPVQASSFGPLTALPYPVETRSSPFDLSVSVIESPDNQRWVQFDYNTALFDDDRIARMLDHYFNLLRAVASAPACRIADLPLLDANERRRLLVEFNDTQVELPPDTTVHRLFEEQVGRTPDALALICGAERLSYRQLNERANRLAHDLIRRGVRPEVPVAIFAERSSAMVAGILAVLKAGGAYVPLDLREPRTRLAEIFEQVRPPFLLTDSHLAGRLPGNACGIVYLDRSETSAENVGNPAGLATPANLAYILFTSGSTGRPKGVAVEHRNTCRFIRWAVSVFAPEELARTLFSTSISFDLSVFEMFVPLSAGGAAVLADNILELGSLPGAEEITLINTVPSAMKEIVHEVPGSVKVVNLAGEPLPDELVHRLHHHTAIEKVYNLYGPTEVTTYATYALVGRDQAVTIGRPISNTRAYVLDSQGGIAPIGIAGELHLSGDTVSRGYHGRPDLTRQRFVSNPYGASGERMYRTGDVCRYLPDGRIQHLGRTDLQVKIKGFRIELEEVEAAFDGHVSVRRAVVTVHESPTRGRQLVAYVVPASGQRFNAGALRAVLEQRLPRFMVPDIFVPLRELPLTAAGKVDRRSLPDPPDPLFQSPPAHSAAAPRDSLEMMLVRIWEDVLGVPNLGIRDNFFELGGHSLLAARVMFDVHKATGRRIPLSALFRRPTIEQLADSIRTGSANQLDPVISPIQRGNGGLPLFAVAAPGVEILGHVLLARHMGDQPVYKIQGHHRPSEREFLYSDDELQTLALEYIDALRVFQPRGPYCLAAMCEGAHIAEKMVRELEARSEEVALFAIVDTWVLQNQTVRSLWLLHRCSRVLSVTARHLCTGQWSLLGRAVRAKLRERLTRGVGSPYAEAVWPGKDFRAGTFRAPVLLFRQPAYPYYFVNDPEMGWGKRCLSQVETCVVPCGHEEMLRKPFVAGVGQRLAQRIRDISVRAAQHVSTTRVVTEESTVSTWPAPDASR